MAVREAEDGERYWDDDLLYNLTRGEDAGVLADDADQILFGRDHPGQPRLTHYLLTATAPTRL